MPSLEPPPSQDTPVEHPQFRQWLYQLWASVQNGSTSSTGVTTADALSIAPLMGMVTIQKLQRQIDDLTYQVAAPKPAFLFSPLRVKQFFASTFGSVNTITATDTGINGVNVLLVGDGATTPKKFIRVIGGVFQIINSAYTTSPLSLTDAGALTILGPISLPIYTVATLPAAFAGARAFVNDALAPAFNASVVGGGGITVPVFYDGVTWKVG